MKKIYLLLVFTSAFLSWSNAQNIIALESGSTTTFYATIDEAIANAVDNDFIYLPGGSFTPTGSNLVLDKKLNIIGAGHYPDSTLATGLTTINGSINIRTAASGGSLQGLYVTGTLNFGTDGTNGIVNGFNFSRCYFASSFSLTYDNSALSVTTQNINFSENVFKGIVYFANAKNLNISKNIFESYLINTNGQVIFSNNVFLQAAEGPCLSTPTFHNIQGAEFHNNIINNTGCSGIYAGPFSGNTFYNNMFSSVISFPFNGNPGIGNISNQSINDIFVIHSFQVFSYLNNYHLKTGCLGIGAGSDGTDIGLYGTMYPYKPGAVPSNPHISVKSIAPQTNSQGNLNISIKVGAQNN